MPSPILTGPSGASVADFRHAKASVIFDAGPGPDLVLGSKYADTFLGGTGSDALLGNRGNDTLEGGLGLDAVAGGKGSDTFVFRPGDLITSRAWTNGHGGLVDTVLGFQGAGTSGPGQQDVIWLEGFGADTTLSFAGLAGGVGSLQYYEVEDPTTPGADGFILVSMAHGRPGQLTAADVVVVPPDRPVTAEDDAYAATEDTALTVGAAQGVLANDDAPDGSRALVVPAGGTIATAQGGTVTIAADGSFTYQPAPNFNGQDSFAYTVRDADGDTDTGTVTLMVAAVQDPVAPVLLADVAQGQGGFRIVGEAAFNGVGLSVSGAGDVNGDGLDDLLVGASGAAYVVFGRAGGAEVNLDDLASGASSQGFKIVGDAEDSIGVSVSGAGDVNGDGLDDLLVGAPSDDAGGAYVGAAYVVFGQAGSAEVNLDDVAAGTSSQGFKITGEGGSEFGDGVGLSVSGAGDVNGDGLDDLLVSASNSDAGGVLSGAAYVVFGQEGGAEVNLDDVAAGTGGFKIVGEAEGDIAGDSVSGAGDVNGDGRPDFLIGAPGAGAGAGPGAAYVVFGQEEGAEVNLDDVAAGIGGFKIVGEAEDFGAGDSVSAAGDVNGDGLADVLVGAPFNDAGGEDAGAAYVVFGQVGGAEVNLDDVAAGTSSQGFKIVGEAEVEFDQTGWSVSGVGDLNGDGLDDLLVGTNRYSGPGAAYVVFGKEGGAEVNLDDLASGASSQGFKIVGETEGDAAGYSVSGAGDVNGDGLADLLLSAPNNSASDEYAGAAYVVYGSDDWLI